MRASKQSLESQSAARNRPSGESNENPRSGFADRGALQAIARWLCFFAGYLLVVEICGVIFQLKGLVSALLQFVPYCLVLVGVVYRGRRLARADEQTLLMATCLGCVFVVFLFDITKNLTWLDSVPLVGRESRARHNLESLAIMVAIASFPAATYLMIEELLLADRKLDEQVARLQEALGHVRRLQGLLPICMYCHKIRTDEQVWQQLERYISEHSDATFTHSMCPECAKKNFPELKL
jgi:hypothetical protein